MKIKAYQRAVTIIALILSFLGIPGGDWLNCKHNHKSIKPNFVKKDLLQRIEQPKRYYSEPRSSVENKDNAAFEQKIAKSMPELLPSQPDRALQPSMQDSDQNNFDVGQSPYENYGRANFYDSYHPDTNPIYYSQPSYIPSSAGYSSPRTLPSQPTRRESNGSRTFYYRPLSQDHDDRTYDFTHDQDLSRPLRNMRNTQSDYPQNLPMHEPHDEIAHIIDVPVAPPQRATVISRNLAINTTAHPHTVPSVQNDAADEREEQAEEPEEIDQPPISGQTLAAGLGAPFVPSIAPSSYRLRPLQAIIRQNQPVSREWANTLHNVAGSFPRQNARHIRADRYSVLRPLHEDQNRRIFNSVPKYVPRVPSSKYQLAREPKNRPLRVAPEPKLMRASEQEIKTEIPKISVPERLPQNVQVRVPLKKIERKKLIPVTKSTLKESLTHKQMPPIKNLFEHRQKLRMSNNQPRAHIPMQQIGNQSMGQQVNSGILVPRSSGQMIGALPRRAGPRSYFDCSMLNKLKNMRGSRVVSGVGVAAAGAAALNMFGNQPQQNAIIPSNNTIHNLGSDTRIALNQQPLTPVVVHRVAIEQAVHQNLIPADLFVGNSVIQNNGRVLGIFAEEHDNLVPCLLDEELLKQARKLFRQSGSKVTKYALIDNQAAQEPSINSHAQDVYMIGVGKRELNKLLQSHYMQGLIAASDQNVEELQKQSAMPIAQLTYGPTAHIDEQMQDQNVQEKENVVQEDESELDSAHQVVPKNPKLQEKIGNAQRIALGLHEPQMINQHDLYQDMRNPLRFNRRTTTTNSKTDQDIYTNNQRVDSAKQMPQNINSSSMHKPGKFKKPGSGNKDVQRFEKKVGNEIAQTTLEKTLEKGKEIMKDPKTIKAAVTGLRKIIRK